MAVVNQLRTCGELVKEKSGLTGSTVAALSVLTSRPVRCDLESNSNRCMKRRLVRADEVIE